ncbi:unnamed protein product [Arctogadus glacialis]
MDRGPRIRRCVPFSLLACDSPSLPAAALFSLGRGSAPLVFAPALACGPLRAALRPAACSLRPAACGPAARGCRRFARGVRPSCPRRAALRPGVRASARVCALRPAACGASARVLACALVPASLGCAPALRPAPAACGLRSASSALRPASFGAAARGCGGAPPVSPRPRLRCCPRVRRCGPGVRPAARGLRRCGPPRGAVPPPGLVVIVTQKHRDFQCATEF